MTNQTIINNLLRTAHSATQAIAFYEDAYTISEYLGDLDQAIDDALSAGLKTDTRQLAYAIKVSAGVNEYLEYED